MMRFSCEMFFDWLRNCVQVKLLNLVQVALTKIPRNEAKIYQETEFHSSEGYLFNFSWLLPGLQCIKTSLLDVVQVRFAS